MTKTELITLLVMALALWLLIQFTGLKFWHAAVVFAAGFYLAYLRAPDRRSATWPPASSPRSGTEARARKRRNPL